MSLAEMVNHTELATGSGITKQQWTHFEPHTIVVPAGVKPSCPGTLRDGSMEHMGRVAGVHPTEDPIVGYRFREKLRTALTTATTGIIPGPWRDLRSDLLDVHSGMDAVISTKEVRQLSPRSRRIAPPDPPPGYPGKSSRPADASYRHRTVSYQCRSIHSVTSLAQTHCALWRINRFGCGSADRRLAGLIGLAGVDQIWTGTGEKLPG